MCEKPAQEEGRRKASKPGPPMGLQAPLFILKLWKLPLQMLLLPGGGIVTGPGPSHEPQGSRALGSMGRQDPASWGKLCWEKPGWLRLPRSLME